MQRRADDLDLQAALDAPTRLRFHWRRIPGTLVLAITNLIASFIALDPDAFIRVLVLSYAGRVGGALFWSIIFGASAILLFLAIITRRWCYLNAGSVLSLFAWTAVCMSMLFAWLLGVASLSPIALSLLWWMVAGQAAMLVTPLLARGEGHA